MPQRPPSHVLETTSEKAYWNAIPDRWVLRLTGGADYGIDGRVEIFEPTMAGGNDQTTGLTFSVQLKATADESTDSMRVGVPWGHMAYWLSLSEPVLVVRYLASTKALYAMWAHERRRDRDQSATKKAWFRFRESDRLDVDRAGEITAAVQAFRAARSGEVRLPVELRIGGERATASLEASWNAELAARLGDTSVRVARLSTSMLQARVDDALTVDFGGGIAITMHAGGGVGDPYTVDDLLVVLGMCFGRVGAFHDAASSLRAGKASQALWAPETFSFAVHCCAQANDHALAIELIEACPAPMLVQEPLLLLGLDADRLDGELRSRMLHIQDRLVAEPGEDRERARALFYRASLARSFDDHPSAVNYYDQALDVWPGYRDSPDFWTHRAGSAFLTDDFDDAASSYLAAIEAGDGSDLVRANCADALLQAGRYSEVVDLVLAADLWLPDERVTYFVAGFIIERFGITQQQRDLDPDVARAALRARSREELQAVADRDALVPALWFNLDRVSSVDGPHPIDLIIAARIADVEPALWASAIAYGFMAGVDEALLCASAARAKKRTGPGFIEQLIEHTKTLGLPYDDAALEPPDFEPLFRLVNTADSFVWPETEPITS